MEDLEKKSLEYQIQILKEKNSQMEDALGYALNFLEDLPTPPMWIVEEINKCLEIEY